ncbi:35279_t:CDS:2 [Gigaspora margarita]|uniref:35279_t:CDS:1 n=1 Tax=Gigaspora margarita TaxID=4874 RepID=A0ABN7UIV9_GIGMA|nr:35279_t:CDS:2 [Gigaspora margarita]
MNNIKENPKTNIEENLEYLAFCRSKLQKLEIYLNGTRSAFVKANKKVWY